MSAPKTLSAFCLAALLTGGSAAAQQQATLVLRSGERLNAEVLDMSRQDYFTVRVNGQERRIPMNDLSIIDFTGGGAPKDTESGTLKDNENAVFLKNGQNARGRLDEVSQISGLKIVILTDRGPKEYNSRDVDRIYISRPVDMNSRTLTVPGNVAWIDTVLNVRQGQQVTFQATGRITLSQNGNDLAQPAGSLSGRYAIQAPIPRSLAGALIGRIDTGPPFGIGNTSTPLTMPANGRLFLGINDDVVNDNTGQFTVTIKAGANP